MKSHILGFPRIGSHRELKFAVEAYWRGESTETELLEKTAAIKQHNWQVQKQAGLDYVTVGDFSLYDHVLDLSRMAGAVPSRFNAGDPQSLDTYFQMARGDAAQGIAPMEMTKWFDTNYHYIVPEIEPGTRFSYSCRTLVEETRQALALGFKPKPVLLGPLTYLTLAKSERPADRWNRLDELILVYKEIISELAALTDCIQVDEPVFCTDLPPEIRSRAAAVFEQLHDSAGGSRLMLAAYFGALGDNLPLVASLAADILHIDLVRAPEQLEAVHQAWPRHKTLSLGLVDGRNIWKTDLEKAVQLVRGLRNAEQLWIGSSCSLIHCPVSLAAEKQLPADVANWMAFAAEKCTEVERIKQALLGRDITPALEENRAALRSRRESPLTYDPQVRQRCSGVTEAMRRRASPFSTRKPVQQRRLGLPPFPATTIGSFPQTRAIRKIRRAYKDGRCAEEEYRAAIQEAIREVVAEQEKLGLDVLVHGEPERNDMVEYFGQQLNGFCFSQNGWVQSYGSRCVKPPIICGDISRPKPMTLEWTRYARSLTRKPLKGMLTGPVTILCWSFVRDDLPRSTVCEQLALAVRDEVLDLENDGVEIIQIDEAALREGLPLRQRERAAYLEWAVNSFRLAAAGVRDETQIHTHMCYSEFNTIAGAIAAMDADVISIEASRSGMELLRAFKEFQYPNDIGPGVWDIHSPRVPSQQEIVRLIELAREVIPDEQLWINPDCGLKTRDWPETRAALANLVGAARALRNN